MKSSYICIYSIENDHDGELFRRILYRALKSSLSWKSYLSITWMSTKAAPTRANKLFHKLLDDCCRRYKHMWRKFRATLQVARATVWIFELLPWTRSYWINFFSTFRYFSLYLFSNLAYCSFSLFLYSVLVTNHSEGSDLYFDKALIKLIIYLLIKQYCSVT